MFNLLDQNPYPETIPETRVVGKAVHWFYETGSTNALALDSPFEGEVFVAERQTAGRGRHGTRWHSAPDLGLWFSVALEAPLPGISFGAALAVRDALREDAPVELRWPNDLYCGARKIGGLLVEQRNTRIALGIGVNVNHQADDFPSYLRHRAGSLAMATGRVRPRDTLLVKILFGLDEVVQRLRNGEQCDIHAAWSEACDIVGKKVRRGNVCGQVTAIDLDGALVLTTRNGIMRINCGDVSVIAGP